MKFVTLENENAKKFVINSITYFENYLYSNLVPDYGIKNMSLHSTVNRSMRNLGF